MSNTLTIAVLPGDYIGPEIVDASVRVLSAANDKYGLGLSFEEHAVGHASLKTDGTTLTDTVLNAACAASGGIILGPCDNGGYPLPVEGGLNVPGVFRKKLELYANLRPSRSLPGIPLAIPGLDILVVRENTEGFYPDRNMAEGYGEITPVEGVAISMRRITASASERIARSAFEWARRRRKKVTVVTKKHILRMTDGLFHDTCHKVAADYPDVEIDDAIIDSFAADLYLAPQKFDVAVMTNMFGDIMSNLTCALSGGLGLGGGLNAGPDQAMANASHGCAPAIGGLNKANPVSMVTSAAMLLEWLGAKHDRTDLVDAGKNIQAAIDHVLSAPETRTGDVGGTATTRSCADAMIAYLHRD